MAGQSFLERLRQGGPSHELLVLLDVHRVLTTDQLARATGTPVRTVRYRLDQLREHDLVDGLRPGREAGSAPRHWWLRPAGTRLVTGVAQRGGPPKQMFIAHTTAIAEAWLAVHEHGPAAGVNLDSWLPDRAGWQEWEAPGGYGPGRLRRLTPDAVMQARLDDVDGPAVAFWEIDLATMTQGQLREKLGRYLAYAADRAWEGVHPHCPPMLLLTTTPARAVNYLRAARRALAGDRGRRYGADDEADALVVAVCGLVHDPARAVREPVWLLPDEAAAELTLAELLAERVMAQARAVAWRARRDAAEVRTLAEDALDDAGRRGLAELERLLAGDTAAAEALHHLLDQRGSALLDREPELAELVLDWWGTRRSTRRHPAGPAPATLVDQLHTRHREIQVAQAHAVLAARAQIEAEDPRLASAAAVLQAGRLLAGWDLANLGTTPEQNRQELQAAALLAYTERRRRAVDQQLQALGWLARRRADPAELAARYDARYLLACDVCGLSTPRPAPKDPDQGFYDETPDGRCQFCGAGELVDHDQAADVPTLSDRLAALRRLLNSPGGPAHSIRV